MSTMTISSVIYLDYLLNYYIPVITLQIRICILIVTYPMFQLM